MLGLLFSIPLIIFSGILAYARPSYAIAFIITLLPSYLLKWDGIGLPVNTLDVLIIVTTVTWIVTHLDQCKEQIKLHSSTILILELWYFIASMSLFYSSNPIDALGILKSYFLLPVAFILLTLFVIRKKEDLQVLMIGILILVIYISTIGLFQVLFPNGLWGLFEIPNPIWSNPETLRVTSLLGYPNAVSLLIGPLVPLLLAGRKLFTTLTYQLLFIFAALLGIAVIYYAHSKGALVGLTAAFLLYLIYINRTHLWTLAISTVLLILILIPFMDILINKVGGSSYSAQLRQIQWKETVYLLSDNPIIGAGLASYQEAILPYHTNEFLEIFLYPHNILLNFWVELGVFGVITFFYLVGISLKKSYSIHKILPSLAGAGVLSLSIIITHGLVDVPYFKNDLSILFLLILFWPFMISGVQDRSIE